MNKKWTTNKRTGDVLEEGMIKCKVEIKKKLWNLIDIYVNERESSKI